MIPTFLDLRTGKTAQGHDMSVFWWAEGNGACDCNRACAFPDAAAEMREQQHRDKPELKAHQGLCYGYKRFIAIDVEGGGWRENSDGLTTEQVLIAMNSEYGK